METDYKSTLFLPETNFAMKANLSVLEKKIQSWWNEEKVFLNVNENNKKNKKFLLVDGPPYANGSIHIGHALNKILKDISVKFHMMKGDYVMYQLCWDTHGLPIENAVLKKLALKNFHALDNKKIKEACKNFATEQINIQKQQFERLGIFKHDNYLTTFDEKYQLKQIEIFLNLIEQDLIYRQAKPIYWSWSSESAMAESEIEYANKKSLSLFIGYKLENFSLNNTYIIAWTTTPWTLPANQALAINKNIKYCLFKNNNLNFIFAEKLWDKFASFNNFTQAIKVKEISYEEILKLRYSDPISQEIKMIYHADFVEETTGSGIVHIAPAHGQDDYLLAIENNLKIVNVIDKKGLLKNSYFFDNLFYETANEKIKDFLNEKHALFGSEVYEHSYPHDWRTNKPIVTLASPQWFISLEKLKDNIEKNLKEISITPHWGKEQLEKMLLTRKEWCISRQRKWGICLPILYNKQTNEIYKSKNILENIYRSLKNHGVDNWETIEIKELLIKENIELENVAKETDIMDVWFDSGCLFAQYEDIADLYIEGVDQFRGWFNSSNILSTSFQNKNATKKIIAHGFVCDEAGNKMSKSLGNVVDPIKICEEYGSDILRLWVASVNFETEVKIGKNTLAQIGNLYRKIRNTLRFLLSNIGNENELEKTDVAEIDKYVLWKLFHLQQECIKYYENLELEKIYSKTNDFIVNYLSAFYLDFIKDIIYIENKNNLRKKQIIYTLNIIFKALVNLYAPIIPHTAEEAWSNYSLKNNSIFHNRIDEFEFLVNDINEQKWKHFWNLKNDVYKELENLRNSKVIGKSLEASIIISLKGEYEKYFSDKNFLKEVFMVSELEIVKSFIKCTNYSSYDTCDIFITKHEGEKCQRCWKHFHKKEIENNLCTRCKKVLNEK